MKPLAQNTLIQNRYLIVHLIGKGGMGEVYLAVDQRLGSAVALKRTFFAGDEMLGSAFEREARTLARMRHPVLPKVSDHFSENDEQYLVMEHISGDDLAKRLEAAGKPFPVSWVLFWADQLLDALSYLHTHEPPIIHRDIKPQNLKLTDENHVILLDFGLSKTSTGQTNISQSGSTGSVVGYTPHYAPMEQIRGIGTSPRSDLYSLSATLYQLLTNHVPVDALSRADAMLNELPDPIKPPHELNPEIPKVVSDVLLRGMEVSQEKRFANAREMQRVLRKAYSEIQQATTANTVAFTAQEAQAALNVPAATGSRSDLASFDEDQSSTSDPGSAEAPAIAPDASIDLDATMAYTPSPTDSGVKQSSVKTEVFVHDGLSFGESASHTAESSSFVPAANETQSEDPAAPAPGIGDATIPFMDLGDADNAPASPSAGADTPQTPVFFEDERVAESEPEESGFAVPSESDNGSVGAPAYVTDASATSTASAASADYQSRPAAVVQPKKSGSGKTLAIIGGIAFLLLLGVAAAAGIWAYVTYSGSQTDVEPTPVATPQETIVPTPSPEPTLEMGVNSDSGNTNSNVNASSENVNANSGQQDEPETEPANNGSAAPPANGRSAPRSNQTSKPNTPRPPREQQPNKTKPSSQPRVLP